mgnify:FL=1
MKKTLAIAPILLFIAACGQNSGGSGGFESREAEWEAGMNAADVEAMVALYAADARLMPPNGPASVGHEGVRASFGGMIEAGLTVDLTPIDIQTAGDIAFVIGTYELQAGDDVADRGKYIETWGRDAGGEWKITNDTWNSDLPAAGGGGGGDGRTHMLILHEVEDGDRWLAAWSGEDGRRVEFKANGAAHVHTFRNADNPNLTGLVISVADMDAINAFLSSAEGVAAAEADGVNLDEMTVLIEAK